MKARTTAKTAMINALLAIAVMVPATQAQAGFKGELAKLQDKFNITIVINKGAGKHNKHKAHKKSATRPNMRTAWNSSFGKIHWGQNFYGNKGKTLHGKLIKMRNGRYAYIGKFGRKGNRSIQGYVKFVFAHNGKSFKGHYVSSQNGQIKPWNGNR